jgi:hypothetical protein
MSTEEVVSKARELFQIALPHERVEQLIRVVLDLDTVDETGELTHIS